MDLCKICDHSSDFFLAHLSRRLIGELLVYRGIRRPSVRPSSTFSNDQGQLLEGVECHIYLYCFTFDDINLNRALVIIVLFPTKYSNKKVCANDIRK